jgi:hypothetical protein
MPRDITIITPVPLTWAHWAAAADAAAQVSDEPASLLGVPPTDRFVTKPGLEALTISEPGLGTVLTVGASRPAQVAGEVLRLVPEANALAGRAVWWTEAWAPWGPGGAAGVSMSRVIAHALGGVVQAADGE